MSNFIFCPICENRIDLEVSYSHLEMVGHFQREHPEIKIREDWSAVE